MAPALAPAQGAGFTLNPLAPLMRPVQQTLLSVSRKLRACVHALDGRADPVATASLAAALFALAALLALYAELLHRPVSWLLGWLGWLGARALGVALFGPQNRWLARRAERAKSARHALALEAGRDARVWGALVIARAWRARRARRRAAALEGAARAKADAARAKADAAREARRRADEVARAADDRRAIGEMLALLASNEPLSAAKRNRFNRSRARSVFAERVGGAFDGLAPPPASRSAASLADWRLVVRPAGAAESPKLERMAKRLAFGDLVDVKPHDWHRPRRLVAAFFNAADALPTSPRSRSSASLTRATALEFESAAACQTVSDGLAACLRDAARANDAAAAAEDADAAAEPSAAAAAAAGPVEWLRMPLPRPLGGGLLSAALLERDVAWPEPYRSKVLAAAPYNLLEDAPSRIPESPKGNGVLRRRRDVEYS